MVNAFFAVLICVKRMAIPCPDKLEMSHRICMTLKQNICGPCPHMEDAQPICRLQPGCCRLLPCPLTEDR